MLAEAIITTPDPVPFQFLGIRIQTHAEFIVFLLAVALAAAILLYFVFSWLFRTSKGK